MSYEETHVEDTETRVLTAMADDKPYVFIRASFDDMVSVQVTCGGGVGSAEDIRAILNLTLSQLPEN